MMLFIWNEDWETGLQDVDDQHRSLLLQMDQLFEAIRMGEERAEVTNTMRHLALYVDYHFSHEERLMAEAGYPGLEEHRKAHDALRGTVQKIIQAQVDGSPTLLEDVTVCLQDWLFHLLDTLDRRMAAFLREVPAQIAKD